MTTKDITKGWVYTPKKINVARGVGYGLIDLTGGAWANMVSGVIFTYLMLNGIEPAAAGMLTGIGRIVDAFMCVITGALSDRFYQYKLGKKFGRRHFFILIGGIMFTFIFPLFWFEGSFWYYLAVYIAIEIAITFILVPWEIIPTEMTEDYKLRTVLSGSRMTISATGTTLVFFVLAVVKNLWPTSTHAYLITGIIWTVIFVAGIFISYRVTWERPLTPEFIAHLDAQPKKPYLQVIKEVFSDYGRTLKNKAFVKHLWVFGLSFTGKDLFVTMFPSFIMYCVYLSEGQSWTLLAMSFIGIPASIFSAFMMVKKGPRFLFSLGYSIILCTLAATVAIYFLHVTNIFVILLVVQVIYQFGRGILEFVPWNLLPFMPDIDYIMTRRDRAGTYAGMMVFVRKTTGALSSWVAGFLFAGIGFSATAAKKVVKAGGHLDLVVQNNLFWCFILCPAILIALALILAQHFRLNRHTHKFVIDEIHRLEEGGSKADVDNETKLVCEQLTGHPYSELWPEVDANSIEAEKLY